jgi:hypothetical protein
MEKSCFLSGKDWIFKYHLDEFQVSKVQELINYLHCQEFFSLEDGDGMFPDTLVSTYKSTQRFNTED